MLVTGSEALVEGATTLAYAAGISEATVGLTVVAIGTSAPELATGILAARKGQSDIGVGKLAAFCTNGCFSCCIAADDFGVLIAACVNNCERPLPDWAPSGHLTVLVG